MKLEAPFPWFGGKRDVAPQVWAALGNVAHYVGSVLKGNTVLNYSSGKLVSAPFTAV